VSIKIVKDFKRGQEIPATAKYLSSRLYTRTEQFDGGHPQEWDTRIAEQYHIDTYEIFTEMYETMKEMVNLFPGIAYGEQLDKYGELLGLKRDHNEPDAEYRIKLGSKLRGVING
jgi:hypothetical protein